MVQDLYLNIVIIIDNVFLGYGKMLNETGNSNYSLNGYVTMLSFLSIYCWANLFIIKSNENIRVKLENNLVNVLVNARSIEIRIAAQTAITSMIVNTIFDPKNIIRRLKKLWDKESKKEMASSLVDDSPLLNTQSSIYEHLEIENVENESQNGDMDDDLNEEIHRERSRQKSAQSDSSTTTLSKLHGISLGFCAIIQSTPYDVPSWLPSLILYLNPLAYSKHVIIKTSIRKSISEFKKTHAIAWNEHHKPKFSEEELEALNDMSINHSYFS